jgi:hypothetical protein
MMWRKNCAFWIEMAVSAQAINNARSIVGVDAG